MMASHLVALRRRGTRPHTLILINNGLSDTGAMTLAPHLATIRTLHTLDLRFNNISAVCRQALALHLPNILGANLHTYHVMVRMFSSMGSNAV